jgi:hypothetical protein
MFEFCRLEFSYFNVEKFLNLTEETAMQMISVQEQITWMDTIMTFSGMRFYFDCVPTEQEKRRISSIYNSNSDTRYSRN